MKGADFSLMLLVKDTEKNPTPDASDEICASTITDSEEITMG